MIINCTHIGYLHSSTVCYRTPQLWQMLQVWSLFGHIGHVLKLPVIPVGADYRVSGGNFISLMREMDVFSCCTYTLILWLLSLPKNAAMAKQMSRYEAHTWSRCILFPCLQDQYVFIHDALSDFLTCGDTSVPAHELRRTISAMSERDGEGKSGFKRQFEVSYLYTSICASYYNRLKS